MGKTFHIENFGCRATQADGASIHEELVESRARPGTIDDAEVVIVNSCTVTEEADRQVRQTIRRVARRNPKARIIVTGCYAQRSPEELRDLPGVRYVVGNSHKPIIGGLTLSILDDELIDAGRAEIFCSEIFLERHLHPTPHSGSAGRTRAIVKVQDGCNANCSFCIIPSVRGRSRSLPISAVVSEVEGLVRRGYPEVVLSGIHLGSYGRDLEPRSTFVDLVRRLADLPGLARLRLSSIEPLEVVPELIDLVAGHSRIAGHFHIPLQSGSARILRAMHRPYTPDYYAELVRRIRARDPFAAIGADVMVGFPGETDEEFLETHRLIGDLPLTYIHVFPYSRRPGTPAAALPSQVPDHVSKHRAGLLRRLVREKNAAFRRGLIGRELQVLVLDEEPENGSRSALSENFVRVVVPADTESNAWISVVPDSLTEDGVSCCGRLERLGSTVS